MIYGMADLRTIVTDRIKELDLKPIAAAESVGLERGFIRDIIAGRKKSVASDKMVLVAHALQLDPGALAQGVSVPVKSDVRPADIPVPTRESMPRNVPVFGTVAGSMNGHGSFQLTSDVVDYVARPPGIAAARDVYALYVEGESMTPLFSPGDLVFVNPHKPIRVNDAIIIQEADTQNGLPAAFIKLFKRRTERGIITEQLNPRSEITFLNREGTKLHKVLTLNELFGV